MGLWLSRIEQAPPEKSGIMKETSCFECGQIQGSLKLQFVAKVILNQALLFPGREGAETSCRLESGIG